MKEICVIPLVGVNNYAVVSEGRITYGLNASSPELEQLIEEEKAIVNDHKLQEDEVGPSVASICLIPTFNCNLRCQYCYALGGDTKEVMPLSMAKTAIMEADDSKEYEHLNLYLAGGGEPLLHFDLVRDIVDFARSIYSSVSLNLISNGTFNENVLLWLKDQKADLRISYDGVMHDKQRPYRNNRSSKDRVVENIRALAISEDVVLCVQSVITKNGLIRIKDTLDDIASLGVDMVKIEPSYATDTSRGGKSLNPGAKDFATALFDAIKHAAQLGMKLDTGFFSEPSSGYYCGIANVNRTVTPHGLITRCVEVARPNDPYSNRIICGTISKNKLIVGSELEGVHYSERVCKSCNLRLICHGGCPMFSIWEHGFPITKSTFVCTVEHELLPALLYELAVNPALANVVIDDEGYNYC